MSTELKKLDAGFMALNQKVNKIEALLSACDPTKRLGHHDIFNKMLAEVEQRWEQDVKAVKRELHQTILAHNHNANLMAGCADSLPVCSTNMHGVFFFWQETELFVI